MEQESNPLLHEEETVLSNGSDKGLVVNRAVGDVAKTVIASTSELESQDIGPGDAEAVQQVTKLQVTVSEEPNKPVTLKREVTPFSGVLIVVNQFIGSGIFITQSGILDHAGSFGLSLLCWVFGGIIALAGAMCYLELGLLVRKTGGEYAILLEAYSFRKKNRWVEMLGSLVSFLYTWTNVFLLRGVAVSIITLTCARYFTRPFFIGCDVPVAAVKLLALSILSKFNSGASVDHILSNGPMFPIPLSISDSNSISANCSEMSGTVPELEPMSRIEPTSSY